MLRNVLELAQGSRQTMGRRTTRPQVTFVNLALICCNILLSVSARPGASPPSSSMFTADQLTKLGQKSTGQVVVTATHTTGETVKEGQRQVGNLGEAAQIAGSPIVSGVTDEGKTLMNVAQVLGMPGLENMLAGQMGGTEEPDQNTSKPRGPIGPASGKKPDFGGEPDEDTSKPHAPNAPQSGKKTDFGEEPDEDTSEPRDPMAPASGKKPDFFGGDTTQKSEDTGDMPPAMSSTPTEDQTSVQARHHKRLKHCRQHQHPTMETV